jgi:L-threonylcarbamoyladenylate synthase
MPKIYKTWEEVIMGETRESVVGKVFVLPTDTIYGFSCLKDDEVAVKKILELKQIYIDKPFIVLTDSVVRIESFGIPVTDRQKYLFSKIWPGPVTIIMNERDSFRIPDNENLINFIKKFGSIYSTSANVTGEMQTNKTEDIIEKFGDKVDFILDIGELNNPPSTIIKIVR